MSFTFFYILLLHLAAVSPSLQSLLRRGPLAEVPNTPGMMGPELIAHVSPFPFLPFGMGVMCLHGFDYWDVSGKVNRTQENHGESFIFLLTLEALQGRI